MSEWVSDEEMVEEIQLLSREKNRLREDVKQYKESLAEAEGELARLRESLGKLILGWREGVTAFPEPAEVSTLECANEVEQLLHERKE